MRTLAAIGAAAIAVLLATGGHAELTKGGSPRIGAAERRAVQRLGMLGPQPLQRGRPRLVTPQVWLEKSRFIHAPLAQLEQRIAIRIAAARRAQLQPVVLVDIDSTLFPTEPRSGAIYREWAGAKESEAFPLARALVAQLTDAQVPYGHGASLKAAGLAPSAAEFPAAEQSLGKFWAPRFFSDAYVARYDRPYPGAAAFVQRLLRSGARVIYLTGRDPSKQREGTLAALAKAGMPLPGERVELAMRTSGGDAEFKARLAQQLRDAGQRIIALIDNEPANLAAVRRVVPRSLSIFFHSVHSAEPARPLGDVYYLSRF